MPAKKLGASGSYPADPIDMQQIDRIAAVKNLFLEEKHRRQLVDLIIGYRDNIRAFGIAKPVAPRNWPMAVLPGTVAALLKKIDEQSSALRDELAEVHRQDNGTTENACDLLDDALTVLDVDFAAVRWHVTALADSAARARATIKLQRGNPGNPSRLPFVRAIERIFVAAGGKGRISNDAGRISGPLFDFVQAALITAGDTASPDAVRGDLGRVSKI